MISSILPDELYFAIAEKFSPSDINEIRLRVGKPVYVAVGGKYCVLYEDRQKYIAGKDLIDSVLSLASGNSMYAVNDLLIRGFLNCEGGIRVGVGGEAVSESGGVAAIKNINSVCIRVPHQVKGCLKNYRDRLVKNPANTLIVSKPGAGKTTFLRELTRLVSDSGKNCLLIDERGELAAVKGGIPALNVGDCTDILTAIPKNIAYENAVRSMAPDVIVTDEVFGKSEVESIKDIIRCGVLVFATVHAADIKSLQQNKEYKDFLDLFRYVVLLDSVPSPGHIAEFTDREGA